VAKEIETRDLYRVGTSGADVKVSVDVGLSQEGMTKVLLGTTPIVTTSPPIGQLNIGPGAGLDGELLIVETLVTDVSTKTDKMQVIVSLEGGPKPKTLKADGEVSSAGDSILFRTFVAFRE
jgi:hypothetical protein